MPLTADASHRSLPNMSAIRSIRNLGPKSEATFARAGIASAEELRSLGADAAYLRAIKAGMRPHFISYYALVLGLQGRPWTDCTGSEKIALRQRFDALCAAPRALSSTAEDEDSIPATLTAFLKDFGIGRTAP